ncbi:hypothetical protein [Pseudonocardia acaciae]|uniref:hypothetical protein n=1 Tax=Pseudonocardia acaciae TaxID=551276 RepID=UPI00068839F3|nr:hypothetical protein [Pseudonocardia acaciae]
MARTPMRTDRIALGRIEPLSREERLVLAVVAQRYLRYEVDPRPVPRPEVARQLRALSPGESWSEDRVDRVLSLIELRSNVRGPGAEPGDAGLAVRLVACAVLVPPDLRLLDVAHPEPTP